MHYTLARHLCAFDDVTGPKIDLNPYMRIEAQSLRSSAMELAHVSSYVPRADDCTRRRRCPSLWTATMRNLLVFPMLHDKGVGGFSASSLPIAVRSPLADMKLLAS
jgi:hypothetical protein